MAMEVPGIATAVGVNSKIIQDGVNGFTARSPEEWKSKLQILLEDPSLREKIGESARMTVVNEYSKDVWFPRLLESYTRFLSS
jgi:glycosyltransferase involved in cell wall biosynthesis